MIGHPTLRAEFLGGWRVWRSDGTPVQLRSRSSRSLLAYLIVHRERSHARDHLAALFWADAPEPRRRLSHALWQIGTALQGTSSQVEYLSSNPLTVRLEPKVILETDFDLATRDPEALLEAQRGEFLEGFSDDWVLEERERRRTQSVAAVERLARQARIKGETLTALKAVQAIASFDGLREDAHLEAMRLCLLLGRPAEALAQYERCCSALERELGVSPSAVTTALYRRVLGGEATPAPPEPPSGPLPLVGRNAERARLLESLELTLTRRGGTVLVEGESGVGKTRLLEELIVDAQWRGFEILRAVSDEFAPREAYAAVRRALEHGLTPVRAELLLEPVGGLWLREAGRVIPQLLRSVSDKAVMASLEPQSERVRLREALARVATGLTRFAPQVLILDDAQWADDESLEWLPRLVAEARNAALLVVIAYRRPEAVERDLAWTILRTLDADPATRRVSLEPLSNDQVTELVDRASGRHLPAILRARVAEEAQGSPLFVLEMLRALEDRVLEDGVLENRALKDRTFTASDAHLPFPGSLRQIILGRLSRVRPASRAALEAVAVLGVDADRARCAELCVRIGRYTRLEALEALETELIGHGWLQERATGLRFLHDRLRETVYGQIQQLGLIGLHRAAGELLEADAEIAPGRLAQHFELGLEGARAFVWHTLAAERAEERFASQTVVQHCSRALELGVADPKQRYHLLLHRERALDTLGDRQAQRADLDELRTLVVDTATRLEVLERSAQFYQVTDDFDTARACATEMLGLTSASASFGAQRSAALRLLGDLAYHRGELQRSADQYLESVRTAQTLQNPQLEAQARSEYGWTLSELARPEEAVRELKSALNLYRRTHDRRGQADALNRLGACQQRFGSSEDAVLLYREALGLNREIGHRHAEATVEANWGNLEFLSGDLSEAVQHYETAITIFRQIGSSRAEAQVLVNLASLQSESLEDQEAAVSNAQTALIRFTALKVTVGEAQCLSVLGSIASKRGDPGRAESLLRQSLALFRQSGNRFMQQQSQRVLAMILLDANALEAAETEARHGAEICQALNLPGDLLYFLHIRSCLALRRGELPLALELIERAVKIQSEQPKLLSMLYVIHLQHHDVLRDLGRTDDARNAIEVAYSGLMSSLGGTTPEQRAQALRASDARPVIVAWEAFHVQQDRVRLPRANVPTGRPLRPEDYLEITWTVNDPSDELIPDKVLRRQTRLERLGREALAQGAAPTLEDLARALGSSLPTIKRDLEALRVRGQAPRTRGTRAPRTAV